MPRQFPNVQNPVVPHIVVPSIMVYLDGCVLGMAIAVWICSTMIIHFLCVWIIVQ
jgi:hypothetical protein